MPCFEFPSRLRMAAAALALCSILLAGCASAPTARSSSAVAAEQPSAQPKALTLDRVILAGQPTPDDLRAWRASGVGTVINLRTPSEMANATAVPFDEPALAAELGLDYHHLPIGGDAHPYGPEVLAAYAAALEASDGPLLLHCGTGVRAGLLHAAYAVRHQGQSPDQAMRALEPLGLWPLPLEKLTGIELELQRR